MYYSNAKVNEVEDKSVIKDDTHIKFEKDFSIVGDTYKLEYYITNGSKNYDAKVSINCTGGNEYVEVNNNWVDNTVIESTSTKSGILTLEMIKSYVGEENIQESITCEITASPVGREESGTGTPADKVDSTPSYEVTFNANGGNEISSVVSVKYGQEYGELPTPTHTNSNAIFLGWYTEEGEKVESTTIVNKEGNQTLKAAWYEITNDVNTNGVADIGDEIRVGTESFYVISNNSTEINALAKCNLNVGYNKNQNVTEGIQHETVKGDVSSGTTYGNVAFSNANGWPYANNDTIDIRNESYGDGPVKTALYGTNGYENYIKQTISSASVRLITKGEIETLINDGKTLSNESIKSKADAKGYSWIYSTSYWTQSASSNSDSNVWSLGSGGFFGSYSFHYGSDYGVRPVITISEV